MPLPVLRRLADLQPVEYNPRTITEHQAAELRSGIEEFGLVQPIVVNTFPGREGRIVGGEQRWRQLSDLGEQEGLVIEVYLEPAKERELNLRLNRNQGEWDWTKLEEFFERDELVNWGFEPWEFGEVPQEQDKGTNNTTGPSHDTGAYFASTIKKFEVLVPAAEYEAVSKAFAAAVAHFGVKTNTEAVLELDW